MRPTDLVTTRVLCLAAFVTRGNAEYLIGSGERAPAFVELTKAQPKDAPFLLNEWLAKEGLTKGLSPKEQFLMARPAGEWSEREFLNASWRREALTVLLWGLRIVDPLPKADQQLDLIDLLHAAWLLKATSDFRKTAGLCAAETAGRVRDDAEFWLWRVRTTQLQNSPESLTDPRTSTEKLDAIISHAAETGERQGLFKRIGGDFPCFGKPFRDLEEKEWSLIHSICTERLYGLNWLCDVDGLQWDDVETST
jgi:Domain of unknown function (DUF4272)